MPVEPTVAYELGNIPVSVKKQVHDREHDDEQGDERNKLLKAHSANGRKTLEKEVPDHDEKTIVHDHEGDEHEETHPVFHRREEIVFVKGEDGAHGKWEELWGSAVFHRPELLPILF